jgi:hypothetical protein
MGLLTGLLTLPLAPVRGTVWLAERIAEEAARELDEELRTRRELERLQLAYEAGELEKDDFVRQEDELLERLIELQEAGALRERGGIGNGQQV